MGLDCILCRFKLVRLSLPTGTRAVVEGVSYPTISDVDTLPADYPILNVITMPEVITLGITNSFPFVSRSLGSKGFPDIISHLAVYHKTRNTRLAVVTSRN